MNQRIEELAHLMGALEIKSITIHHMNDCSYSKENIAIFARAGFMYSVTTVYNTSKTKQEYVFSDGKRLDFKRFRKRVYHS